MHTGTRLRHLFACLLIFGEPAQPDALWNEFKPHICDDLAHRLRGMRIHDPSPETIYDYGLFLLNKILQKTGHSLNEFPSMPKIVGDWRSISTNPLIMEQMDYAPDELQAILAQNLPSLNHDQRQAYDPIIASVENADGDYFFLSGIAGTGKTFVYNTVSAMLRSQRRIVLCVSSSGISALIMDGGRTAHSMFKIPIDGINATSICSIPKQSFRADLLRQAEALIWDEIGAQHRHAVEAVERTLRDIRSDPRPFGGLTVVLGGDFLQTLPVVVHGTKEDILNSTFRHSPLWNENIRVLFLRQNMRLNQANESAAAFAQWLLDVGNGQAPITIDGKVQLLDGMQVRSAEDLINTIYPGIAFEDQPPPAYFKDRMILAPRNADVGDLNQTILDLMHGDTVTHYSADELIYEAGADPDDHNDIAPEVLRSINSSSLPPGELNLKIGCPVILLRNISPAQGLCNGTRLVVTRMSTRVLEASILGGKHDGEVVMIPRITLIPTASADVVFRFKRRQFPVRLAFSLSINKAQGQSVRHVGLDLRVPVFAHGQLYVALSRVTSQENVKILLPQDSESSVTSNVVYEEILLTPP